MCAQSVISLAPLFVNVNPEAPASAALRQEILNAMFQHDTYFVQMSSLVKTRPYAVRIGQLGKRALIFRVIGSVVEVLNERGVVLRAYRAEWTFDALLTAVDAAYGAKRDGRLVARVVEIDELSVKAAEKKLAGFGWVMTWSHAVQPMSRWHTFRFVRAEVRS